MLKPVAATIAAMLTMIAVPVSAQQRARIDVPIIIGGDSRYDACGGTGVIVGLDPRGDGFLSVRSGPDGHYNEIDRLFNGNQVYFCDRQGSWIAIVYPAGGRDCGVGSPWPVRQSYTGPCRYGWIHSRYFRGLAG